MHLARKETIEHFMRHVGYWSWVHILYTYDESHLVIADEWFLDQIRSARPAALQCRTVRPESYESALSSDIKKILVLCEQNELKIVRSLQRDYPDLHVVSGTYGFACVGVDRYPRLKEFTPPETNKNPKPIFMLTTPYADGEFVAKSMMLNGMPQACEYLARPFSTWLSLHKNFQVSRFYNTVVRHYAKQGNLYWLAQTDVLQSVFQHTSYSLPRLIDDLRKLDARVILVSRGSDWVQSVTAQLLHRTTERSVWTKSPNKKILSVREDGDVLGCLDWGDAIREGEEILAHIEQRFTNCLRVKLDDFAGDQKAGLRDIATFVDAELSDEFEDLDYAAGYETAPNTHTLAVRLQREYVDRLGLHVKSVF